MTEGPTIYLGSQGVEADRLPSSGAPTVRLVHPNNKGFGPSEALSSPVLRMATSVGGGASSADNLGRAIGPPVVRLAHGTGSQGDNVLLGQRGVEQIPMSSLPALLVSFFYLEPFEEIREKYVFRDWALDSGAFSAKNSGKEIDLDKYIEKCKQLKESDPKLSEIFSLDVIGDWRASDANTKKMWAAGIEAIPCFHVGEPWDVLVGMAKDYPKIALGGMALQKGGKKLAWAEQCFARVWPKKIHGFGYGGKKAVMALPWHSTDSTNWVLGACKFGRWQAFGEMSVKGSHQNLRAEIEYYLKLEREARLRWSAEMALLEAQS